MNTTCINAKNVASTNRGIKDIYRHLMKVDIATELIEIQEIRNEICTKIKRIKNMDKRMELAFKVANKFEKRSAELGFVMRNHYWIIRLSKVRLF